MSTINADLVDDWGWNNIGYRGNQEILTPNMDALAAEGVKLDRFYTHVRGRTLLRAQHSRIFVPSRPAEVLQPIAK